MFDMMNGQRLHALIFYEPPPRNRTPPPGYSSRISRKQAPGARTKMQFIGTSGQLVTFYLMLQER
jgi:hypothetical protein